MDAHLLLGLIVKNVPAASAVSSDMCAETDTAGIKRFNAQGRQAESSCICTHNDVCYRRYANVRNE